MSLSQPDSRRSRKLTMKFDPPALFTTMSTCPSWSIAAATASVDPGLVGHVGGNDDGLAAGGRDVVGSRRRAPRPSAPRARRRRRPAASATAMARPIPREAPVTKAVLPVRSNRLTVGPLLPVSPRSAKRPGGGVQQPHYLIQHDPDVTSPPPTGAWRLLTRDHLACGTRANLAWPRRGAGSRRARAPAPPAACRSPPTRQDRRRRPGAARATAGSRPRPPARCPTSAPARCRTTSRAARAWAARRRRSSRSRPRRRPARRCRRRTRPSLRAALRRGSPGVEAQHGQVGQRRQPVRRLAEQVAVHHAAGGRQRMQADQRRDRRAARRQGQLADQIEPVGRVAARCPPGARAGPCSP